MLLLAAVVLPALLGNQAPPEGCIALAGPRVNMRANVARATSSPWIDSNGWRFIRDPKAKFCIDGPGKSTAVAAAEAFAFGVSAFIKATAEGLDPFQRMLDFVGKLPQADFPPIVNIGIVDDGTPQAGELMNLLSRRNLLYRVEKEADPRLTVNVRHIESGDPAKQAYAIRQQVGDEKRLLRLYGSEVVVGRLTGQGSQVRLHLLNYAQRPVAGLRVRVLGKYKRAKVFVFGIPDAALTDYRAGELATEFTIVGMNEYAVIDLRR